MVIFIGNLPMLAAEKDICRVARLPAGTHLRVIKKAGRDGELHRYALVQTESQRQGQRLIRRLHGQVLGGNRLVVREFRQRRAANERRSPHWRIHGSPGVERRRSERRCWTATALRVA